MPASIAPVETLPSPPQKHASPLRSIKKKMPLYLYLREQSYYFRLRIPKEYKGRCVCAEIRFSLQTDSLKEARRKAAIVTATVHALFQEKDMVSAEDMTKMKGFLHKQFPDKFSKQVVEYHPTIHALHAWLNEHGHDYTLKEVAHPVDMQFVGLPLPEFSAERLSAFLTGSKRAPMAYGDIRKRIVGYFRYALERDGQNPATRTQREERELPQAFFDMLTPKDMGISRETVYSLVSQQCRAAIDRPPLLCLFSLDYLEKMVAAGLFSIEEIATDNYLQVVNEYCKLATQFFDILLARLKNDYSKEHNLLSLPYDEYPKSAELSEIQPIASTPGEPRRKKAKKLSDFIDDYLATKVADGKKDQRHIPPLREHLKLFIRVASDKPIDAYNRADFRNFRDVLFKLPKNMTKRKDLRDKTMEEILAVSHCDTLQEKTVNTYIVDISALFRWLVTEGYLNENYATRLAVKEKKAEIDSKEPFTLEDLQIIFKSYELEAFKASDAPSAYWVPWISLYTGMRVEEICQLHCLDVYQADGLWVIDINLKLGESGLPQKKVKTDNSLRIIPIHPHLQKLGLLKYHASMAVKGGRLFPELKPSGVRMQYGKKISKDFGPFVRRLGVTGKKTFHSLRHTFSDFFKKRLMHNEIFEQVFGHAHETLASRRYGSRFTPKECFDKLISHIDYGL